jgi:NAD(P)-dependent dehydrogenase (short-subunit alcohol dehydrogenase family)
MELARRGANILAVGHHPARGAAVVEAIHGIGGSAEFLRADTGDAAEIRALAEAVLARTDRIDVLIHSAGGLAPAAALTAEDVDQGFAKNFLGAHLLTCLLEERLLASAPARVIAVGSSTHRMVKAFDVNDFMHPSHNLTRSTSYQRGGYQMRSYQVAKVAVTAWIYSLARRWAGRGSLRTYLTPEWSRVSSGSTSKVRRCCGSRCRAWCHSLPRSTPDAQPSGMCTWPPIRRPRTYPACISSQESRSRSRARREHWTPMCSGASRR